MVTVQREIVTPLLAAEVQELALGHHAECPQRAGPPLLDIDFYCRLAATGVLHVWTLRDNPVLAGYAAYDIVKDPHAASRPYAINVGLYVLPEYRARSLALVLEAETGLRAEGVYGVQQNVQPGSKAEALMPRLGYAIMEHAYFKTWGDP